MLRASSSSRADTTRASSRAVNGGGPPWNGDIPFHAGILFCNARQAPKFDPSMVRKLAEFGWDAPSNRLPVPTAFGPGRGPRPVTVAEHIGLSYVLFAFTAMFSDPAADAKVVGDLYTCRLRLHLAETSSQPEWVNMSVPAKALERLAAHAETLGAEDNHFVGS